MSIEVNIDKSSFRSVFLPHPQALDRVSDAGAQAASDNISIEVSRDIDTFQSDWAWLETEGLSTPFQTRAWLLPFYKTLAPRLNATPVFVLVRNQSSRRPVMMLPLCARRQYGVTIIEFADLGVSDYNAPLIAKTFNPSPSEWRGIWRSITAAFKGTSILQLDKMPHLIGGRPNPLAQYSEGSKAMDIASWGFALPSTQAEYEKRVLHPSFARELAKKNRRVAKRGNVEYVVAQTRDEKREAFAILAQQRQARCDEMGRSNVLADPIYRQFYEAVIVESPKALANLSLLKVDGNTVGTVFSLNHRNAIHIIMSTYMGGEWKSCSLGNVVIQSAIEHAIDNRLGFFDLTIGNEGYKQDFGAVPSALYSALQPLTPAGFSFALARGCYARLKKTAKQSVRSADPVVERGRN
jgi:CelD/BcsL family acetyltransferase involved in cellulose biosynthesis